MMSHFLFILIFGAIDTDNDDLVRDIKSAVPHSDLHIVYVFVWHHVKRAVLFLKRGRQKRNSEDDDTKVRACLPTCWYRGQSNERMNERRGKEE